jgi:hypothetical protein
MIQIMRLNLSGESFCPKRISPSNIGSGRKYDSLNGELVV